MWTLCQADRCGIDYPIVIPAQAGIRALEDCLDAGIEDVMKKFCDFRRAG